MTFWRSLFPLGICGAKTRRGTRCRCLLVLKGNKCKFHGGMSTGPKTKRGKARVIVAARRNLLLTPNWKKHLANHPKILKTP